jgi:hypothetical protein
VCFCVYLLNSTSVGNVTTYWMIVPIIASSLPVRAGDCKIDIHVVSRVAMPDAMVLDPRIRVTSIFGDAGIPVRVTMKHASRDPRDSCGDPIVVQLDESTGYRGTADALAYATPFEGSGDCIHIFLDRLLKGNRSPTFANLLLAHVMVHEITHVLAHSARHSNEGVMKARWTHEDYQIMRYHSLALSPEDVQSVRQGIARRLPQQSLP